MNQYQRVEFEIISIETWNNDISVINRYISASRITYKYLICNNEVKLKYGIQSVPKFFVLDEKRVIRKIITGFDKEKTFVELKETVNQLINE
jgi:hypothetical protein